MIKLLIIIMIMIMIVMMDSNDDNDCNYSNDDKVIDNDDNDSNDSNDNHLDLLSHGGIDTASYSMTFFMDVAISLLPLLSSSISITSILFSLFSSFFSSNKDNSKRPNHDLKSSLLLSMTFCSKKKLLTN